MHEEFLETLKGKNNFDQIHYIEEKTKRGEKSADEYCFQQYGSGEERDREARIAHG